jgi:hypothetical protein
VRTLKKTALEGHSLGLRQAETVASEYIIESEIGTIGTMSHRLIADRKTKCNTADSFFIAKQPREKWHSCRFHELLYFTASHMSDRAAARWLNRIRCQETGIKPTTVRNHIERDGAKIASVIREKAEAAITAAGFDSDSLLQKPEIRESPALCDPADVEFAAAELGLKDFNAADYEMPGKTANISVDDVCVKSQKPNRPMPEGVEKKKRVDNTVIHFENSDGKYILNGFGMAATLRVLLGFLAGNGILPSQQLVFFTDGARSIHNEIDRIFKFINHKIILDWYHLVKKFSELSSMAFKGKQIRNEFLDAIKPLLWRGDIDGAIKMMKDTEDSKVKRRDCLQQLIDYLERVRGCIPCYALRTKLGLRNSSNLGEKSNDLVVATRQKHNGMSWSKDGSVSLAYICCACVNNEIGDWAHRHEIPFKPIPQMEMAA